MTTTIAPVTGRIWRKMLVSLAVLAGSGVYVWQVVTHPPAAPPDETEQAALPPAPALLPGLHDGTFTGNVEDAHYGDLQIRVVVEGGKLTRIRHVKYPRHTPASESINQRAFRSLFKQAIAIQSAEVDIISGATYTSEAFRKSLASALQAAKA
jgi:uncharacterized protein with FMN-binding domain